MPTLSERNAMLARAEKEILAATVVEKFPSLLIPEIQAKGINQYSIRASIWMLIGEGKLRLTDEGMLVLVGDSL